jgi:hypothetical protein
MLNRPSVYCASKSNITCQFVIKIHWKAINGSSEDEHSAFMRNVSPYLLGSWGISVSTVSDCRLDDRGSIAGRRQSSFPVASVSRPVLRPTKPPVQWVPRVLSGEVRRGRDSDHSTTQLLPRSRMSRAVTPLPLGTHMAIAVQLYFSLLLLVPA